MAKIPPHIIDDIMQTARIEEVIGEFIPLKKSGSSLKGPSPFTDEQKPTLVISPSKQIFKCFASGKGGKVVNFLMEHQNMSYPDALRWLADKYNIIIPEEETTNTPPPPQPAQEQLTDVVNGFYTEYYPGRKQVKLRGWMDEQNRRQGTWDYYAENGIHLSMMEYQDGLKHGIFFQRYPTGVIRRTGNYKSDKQVGDWVHYDEKGLRTTIKQFPE